MKAEQITIGLEFWGVHQFIVVKATVIEIRPNRMFPDRPLIWGTSPAGEMAFHLSEMFHDEVGALIDLRSKAQDVARYADSRIHNALQTSLAKLEAAGK